MDIDGYLDEAPEPQRSTLPPLRSTLPDADEASSYGMPAVVLGGKPVAGYAWAKDHCSYFPHSGAVLTELADVLEGHDWSKGTLRSRSTSPSRANPTPSFTRPLPANGRHSMHTACMNESPTCWASRRCT